MKSNREEFSLNPPADPAVVGLFAELDLPADYKDFLLRSNGGRGFLSNGAYADLWRIEELVQFNIEYETRKYAPDVFLFGSNGGGEGYAFDKRANPVSIVQLPFIGMEQTYASHIADSFVSFREGNWQVGKE